MTELTCSPGSDGLLQRAVPALAERAAVVAMLASRQARLVRRGRDVAARWYDFQELRFTRNRLWTALQAACRQSFLPALRRTPREPDVYSFRIGRAGGVPRMVRHAVISGAGGIDDRRSPVFACRQQQLNGAMCVSVSGELDMATATTFRAHLASAAHVAQSIIVDMSGLLYLDSSGINVLLDAHRAVKQSYRQMVLVGPSATVRRILSVLSLEQLMPVVPTMEDALRLLFARENAEEPPAAGL